MKRLLLMPALGLAAVALAAPAHAQVRGWPDSTGPSYGAEQRRPYYDSRSAAYDNGYREGLKEGNKDARKGEYPSYQDEKTFRRADKGYNRSFGDREGYRQAFRNGYSAGYTEAYQRMSGRYGTYDRGRAVPRQQYPGQRPGTYPDYGRYPGDYGRDPGEYGRYPGGSGRYGYSPAFDNGRNDGYQKGLEDANKHRSFDPLRHKWYRSGDHDYHGEYGSKDLYRDTYRRGFQEGYDQGYREGRYRY